MSTKNQSKILVCGDVSGQFNQLFKRVSSVNQKAGPFHLLLCIGDFFSTTDNSQWAPYKSGNLKVPLPTYILGPSNEAIKGHYQDISGCELAENVIYLGPSGIYPCSDGLRIAYLSGLKSTEAKFGGYTNKKVAELEADGRQQGLVDILITAQWPAMVATYAPKPSDCDVEKIGCPIVSRLAHSIAPRYHFTAGNNTHYERLPYRNHKVLQEPPKQVTRFIALAGVGNKEKKKWLYAFNVVPAKHCTLEELTQQPPDVTECPYAENKLPSAEESGGINQFFYGGANQQRGEKRGRTEKGEGKAKRPPPQPTGPCWFCLKSPDVEKHLVVSVGEHIYLAMAKGGLVNEHLMLLPISHYQTSLDLEEAARDELQKFKSRIKEMFTSKGSAVVFYERNYRTSHMQLHAVPVPQKMAAKVGPAFMEHGEGCALPLEEVPRRTELSAAVKPGQPFLFVEPPEGPCLLHRVKKGYNMTFDRAVLAGEDLLNLPNRINWKDCQNTIPEETLLRDQMLKMFKPFDFTLDSDGDDDSD